MVNGLGAQGLNISELAIYEGIDDDSKRILWHVRVSYEKGQLKIEGDLSTENFIITEENGISYLNLSLDELSVKIPEDVQLDKIEMRSYGDVRKSEESVLNEQFEIYPNPTSASNLKIANDNQKYINSVNIYEMLSGKLVKTITVNSNVEELVLGNLTLNKGEYVFEVVSDKYQERKRIVINE